MNITNTKSHTYKESPILVITFCNIYVHIYIHAHARTHTHTHTHTRSLKNNKNCDLLQMKCYEHMRRVLGCEVKTRLRITLYRHFLSC